MAEMAPIRRHVCTSCVYLYPPPTGCRRCESSTLVPNSPLGPPSSVCYESSTLVPNPPPGSAVDIDIS